MSRLVGIVDGRKIYSDDPNLAKLQGDAAYYAIRSDIGDVANTRCDYCGRAIKNRVDCESCGAPTK